VKPDANEPGKFIVLEGIDGCGKTAVADRLAHALQPYLPRTPFLTREPHHNVFRAILEDVEDHIARLMLYLADRALHVPKIQSALKDGHWVIGDRYYYSTIVYNPILLQGGYLGGLMNHEQFLQFVRWCAHQLEPDLVIWLDCPASVCLERLRERGGKEPMADVDLLETARMRYNTLMNNLPNAVRIDATGNLDQVLNSVLEVVVEWFHLEL